MTTVNYPPNRLGRTLTLAAMVDWIGDPYQCGILSGVLEGTRAAGATFLCFVGDRLRKDPAASARHRSFELINRHTVDGLVVLAATLTHEVGAGGLAAYCKEHFGGLPLCSIGETLPGVPSVTSSNASGIQTAVKHLITVHGHRRIACVRGPLAQNEAEQRYGAYVSTLKEHGIEHDDQLVAVGDYMAESGYAAVQHLTKTQGVRFEDLDAIVVSNDGMAVGVLRALEERSIPVPGSIAVTGFDDVELASFTSPPLTTVRQALSKLGRQAARNVFEWTQLGTLPENSEVNTELIIRRSCGCIEGGTRSRQSLPPDLNCGFESALLIRRQHIIDSLARAARGELGAAGREWQAKLLNALVADLNSGGPSEVPTLIADITEKCLARANGDKVCREVVDCLRGQLIVTLRGDPVRREIAEEIFYASHLAIGQVASRAMMRERANLTHLVRTISVTCNKLGSVPDLAHLRQHASSLLRELGLHNFYLVTYRERDPHRAELFLAHDRSQIDTANHPRTFDASTLLPVSLLPALTGRAFAVLPLALREHLLGHMLLELNLEYSYSYDSIADAIACGLHRVESLGS